MGMFANGPAIKFSRCYLTQYRAVSPNFRQNDVTVQGRYGAVFAVRVQIAGRIRVSRYNINKLLLLKYVIVFLKKGTCAVSRYKHTLKPGLTQGTQILLGAVVGIRVYIVLLIYQKGRSSLQKL